MRQQWGSKGWRTEMDVLTPVERTLDTHRRRHVVPAQPMVRFAIYHDDVTVLEIQGSLARLTLAEEAFQALHEDLAKLNERPRWRRR